MLATPWSVDRNGRRARAELVIPDNHLPAVSRAHRYEPDTNPTCHDLARHYGVVVLPTRARKPRDKAKVGVGIRADHEPGAERVLDAGGERRRVAAAVDIAANKPSVMATPWTGCCVAPGRSGVGRRSSDAERQRDAPNSTGCETPGADTGQRGADHITRYRSVGAAWSPANGIPPLSTTFRATPIQSGATRAPQGVRARHPCSGRYGRPPRGAV